MKNLSNQRFGRLVVLEPVGKNRSRQTRWKCKCDCGNEKIITGTSLTRTNRPTQSCGCIQREKAGRGPHSWAKSKFSPEERKQKAYKRQQIRSLKKKHNLTQEEWETFWKKQNGICPLCKKPLDVRSDICVDHDHLTGKNRGLLHRKCNLFLGLFEARIYQIPNIYRYLGGY